MKNVIPWKLIITLAACAVFVFVVLPPLLRGIGGLVQAMNPATALISKLQADNALLRIQNADHLVVRDSINAALQQAQTLTTTKQAMLDQALRNAAMLVGDKARLKATVDSLHEKLISVSTGSGTVILSDSGKLVDGRYEDDWINIHIYGRAAKDTAFYDSVAYALAFRVGDVRVGTEDEFGNRRTIYSVYIQSLRSPSQMRFLDDYAVSETVLKPRQHAWDFYDPRLMMGVQALETLQVTAGIALASYNPGKVRGEDGNLLRLPIGLLSSDFHSAHAIGVGASLNLGYILPIIQNLHVFGGYQWGVLMHSRTGLLFGISAAL